MTQSASAIPGRIVSMRPVEPEDLVFLAEMANDRSVVAGVGGWDFPVPIHAQAAWLERGASDPNTRRFTVLDPDGNAIGLTGLWMIDWHNRTALTALKLHFRDAPVKGAGTDCIKALMAYAFYDVGLAKLWGSILDFNHPSFGAYVKNCGWRIEGVLRREVFRKGRYHDLYRVAILREEFDQLEDAEEYVDRILPVDTSDTVNPPLSWWAQAPRGE